MKIDIIKVVDEIDRYLFKRMDLTEKELKALSSSLMFLSAITTAYMIINVKQLKKQAKKLEQLGEEIEELKNAKGE